ncbi:MAG: M1 family aminopeptidase [Acidobacteriota bacterium]
MAKKILILGVCLLILLSMGVSPNLDVSAFDANPNVYSEDAPAKANDDPIYQKLRASGLSGEYAKLENLALKRDVATITFKRGEFYFLAPIEGQVTGGVFIGEGEFQMTPLLSLEQQHLSFLTGTTSINEKFDKMVLRFTDETYQEIKKNSSINNGAPNKAAQDLLENNKKLLRKGRSYDIPNIAAALLQYNLDMRILIDLSWPGRGGLFQAYFEGKRYGDLMYSIDPLGSPFVAPEEVVLACFAPDNLGIWTAEHLQAHYRAPAFVDENHQLIDMLHHKIEATSKGKRLDATVQTRFKALVDGARVISFDLFPYLRVRKVSDSQGRTLSFIQEDKEEDADFAVILPEGLKKDSEYTLTFEYGGDNAVQDSGGGNFTLVARDNWYPNSLFGDRATYEMTLKVPKGLTMVATGQPTGGETNQGDWTITQWRSEVPLAVAGFNYGKFKKSTVQDDKAKYLIEVYANKELPDSLRQLQNSIEQAESEGAQVEATLGSLSTLGMMGKARAEAQVSIGIYADLFGSLPYGRIAMTQQPFPNFGQAWPMLVYMPFTAYLDSTHRHQLGLSGASDFFKFVAAHEVAHQWWGHVIGWKTYRDQWMSEGFAEFSASMFAQAVYKNEKFIEFWKEERELITTKNREGKRPADVGSVYMGYRLNTARTGNVTRAMIYPKGAFILHMIRMMMWDTKTGDARFAEMMKDFVKTYYNQNVSTQDFWRTVEKHMTKEMDLDGNGKMSWFFGQWVLGNAIPHYKLDYRFDSAENGQVKLVGTVTQSNVPNTFKMIVPIYLDLDGKLRRLGSVVAQGNTTTPEFSVTLPKKPKRVLLCAFEDVLCTIQDSK